MQIYYQNRGLLVRDSNPEDIAFLRNNLKKSDVDEIWASHHKMPYEALVQGMELSVHCLTVLKYEKPTAMFGVVPISDTDRRGVIWMLSTENLLNMRIEFLRCSEFFIRLLFKLNQRFDILFNHVDARNTVSIKWLKSIGANVAEAVPYGEEKLPFHYFEFPRGA